MNVVFAGQNHIHYDPESKIMVALQHKTSEAIFLQWNYLTFTGTSRSPTAESWQADNGSLSILGSLFLKVHGLENWEKAPSSQ